MEKRLDAVLLGNLALLAFGCTNMTSISQGVADIPLQGEEKDEESDPDNGKTSEHRKKSFDASVMKLEEEWQLEQTGKEYWIGYTDVMREIALQGETMIGPLLEFIASTDSQKAKYGAILTLHLIGIGGKNKARFHENFESLKARKALLGLLTHEELQYDVMLLLVRHPWPTDIPVLMETMKKSKTDCWPIVNGLLKYKLEDMPFRQKIKKPLANRKIQFSQSSDKTTSENIWAILQAMKDVLGESVVLEDNLSSEVLYGDAYVRYGNADHGQFEKEFASLLEDTVGNPDPMFSFFGLGNRLQYYLDKEAVIVCSSMSAKYRWLEWWGKRAK